MILRAIIFLNLITIAASLRVVGWWLGSPDTPIFPIENLNLDIYTHIRYGGPLHHPNGTVYCNRTDYDLQRILKLAHNHNIKVQWGGGIPNVHDVLWNPKKKYLWDNYINSIGNAVYECGVDGIELDYEFQDSKYMKLGIVTPEESTHYSKFLADIKQAIGPEKIVSADVSIWGIAPGNYLFGILPWVNATMLNRGDFDFINTMSYHWNKDGEILAWKKDALFVDLWGIDRKRVNIGIPYYSRFGNKEPTWRYLSPQCPNIDPNLNICNGTVFIGKKMNMKIGEFIRKEGFGGAFPWAANYDSPDTNNRLIPWLKEGLTNINSIYIPSKKV